MITRIVRMQFQLEKAEEFLEVFRSSEEKIRAFPGCRHLDLLRDVDHPGVYCTYSIWEDAESLNRYRFSELFKSTWARTKPLFREKAQAFSLEKVL